MTQERRRPETPRAVQDARRLISDPDAAIAATESQRKLSWLVAASAMGRTPRQRRQINDSIGCGVTFEDAHDFRVTDAVIQSSARRAPANGGTVWNLISASLILAAVTAPLLWLSTAPDQGTPARCILAPTSCQTFEDSLSRNARL